METKDKLITAQALKGVYDKLKDDVTELDGKAVKGVVAGSQNFVGADGVANLASITGAISQQQTAIESKQDAISDLNTIRANASDVPQLKSDVLSQKENIATLDHRTETLEDASEGRLYTSTATSGTGTQTVPADALCRAIVKEIDGKTVVQDGQLVSADVSAVKSYDDDDAVIDTHTIPSAVRTSYPLRSAGDVHDSISWDGSKWWHIKRVGTLHITGDNVSHKYSDYYYIKHNLDINNSPANRGNGYAISSNGIEYNFNYYGNTQFFAEDSIVYGDELSSNWADVDALKAYLNANPYDMVYKLATPIVTDITSLMNWDASIAVEAGGTVEFSNQQLLSVDNVIEYKVGKSVVSTTQLNTALVTLGNAKQDVISDLSAIRSGASVGALALPKDPASWPAMTDSQKGTACAVLGAERAKGDWVLVGNIVTGKRVASVNLTGYTELFITGEGIPNGDCDIQIKDSSSVYYRALLIKALSSEEHSFCAHIVDCSMRTYATMFSTFNSDGLFVQNKTNTVIPFPIKISDITYVKLLYSIATTEHDIKIYAR